MRLAYYKARYGPGILGPRGWSCFETYGSSGSSLFITPESRKPTSFFAGRHFSGPIIEYSDSVGDTSGRFEVAQVAARVFPRYRSLVDAVISENLRPASDFPFGPYPADKLTYKSDHLVEFITPSNTVGLGTQSWVAADHTDIIGFATIAGEDRDLFQLNIRLPPVLAALGPVIIQQAEREAASSKP